MADGLFIPGVHTPENRMDQIARIAGEYEQAIFVGSVGRAALVNSELPVQRLPHLQEVRDIDVTNTTEEYMNIEDELGQPFPVDLAFGRLIVCSSVDDYATVRYDWRRPDVAVEMDAEIFRPYTVKWQGVELKTFHPDTMRHIHLIFNNGRAKDKSSIAAFEKALTEQPYSRIPDRLFAPLLDLQQMVRADRELHRRQLVEKLQAQYFSIIPFTARRHITPTLMRLKKMLGLSGRKISEAEFQEELEQPSMTK